MLRRCSIPITILCLVAGSMLAAGSASAAQLTHVAARHTSHASSGHRPGFGQPNFQPGGPNDRYGSSSNSSSGRRGNTASSSKSTNWSGYAVTGSNGTFTSASASWTEPTATCSSGGGGRHGHGGGGSSDQYAAFWVGLDGYANSTVEQTGTDSDCDGSTADYYGWYEMYPAGPVYYSNPVKAGDSFSASVTFSGTNTYTLVLTDNTQDWTQTTVKNVSGLARASAEVITEAPSSNSGVLPLADFGTINYTLASGNGTVLGSQSPIQITMVDNSGNAKDSTSSISGGSFSNTWLRST